MENMEEAFTKIVSQIFNNWYGLRLAVEHGMGGPNSRQTAIECMNYMVQYCLYEPNIDTHLIQETLEDILDEEFETICEDNSPQEVASLLFKFVSLVKQGNLTECEEEYKKLPVAPLQWLNHMTNNTQRLSQDESSSDESDTMESIENTESSSSSKPQNSSDAPMEDDGWTKVKTRRKK